MKKRTIALLLALISVFSLAFAAVPAAAVDSDPAAPVEDTTTETAADQAGAEEAETPDAQPGSEQQETPADQAAAEEPETADDPADTEEQAETPAQTETEEPAAPEKPAGPWYQDAMDFAVREGLIYGQSDGNLNPYGWATRAETIAILMRIFRNTQTKGLWQYSDLLPTDWYYKDLCTAAAMNVLQGYSDRTMRPNAPVTRQEAFSLIARLFGVAQGDVNVLWRFNDQASIGDWAKSAIAGMVEQGYIKGSDGAMRPNDTISRAELAQVLYNLDLTITDDPNEIPEDGIVIYHGTQPVDLEGFRGRLFLGGGCGSAATVSGSAPEAELCVRMDPYATVTVNGTVGQTHLLNPCTTLTGYGNAGAVERAAYDCTVYCANSGVADTFDRGILGAMMYSFSQPVLTPETRSVAFTVFVDGAYCDYTNSPSGRQAKLLWTVDGSPYQEMDICVGSDPYPINFSVSEPIWTPTLSGSHEYSFMLLYGTDALSYHFSVPIRNYTPAEYQQLQSRDYPYQIEVVRNQCTVLIYGQDKAGNYNILYRVCVCSPGYATPLGTFRTPNKMRWGTLMGGVVGQYCTQIYKGFLFHSVYYHSADPSTLYASAYNNLGTICSHGCVRLTVADAKWIYDNCRLGTTVRIYDSNWLPVPKPTAQKIPTSGVLSGWDPTDPDPRNPWH